MNTESTDTLLVIIQQHDGEKMLSELTLTYPNLPNDVANLMNFGLVDAIRAKIGEWASVKADTSTDAK
jgi:hypothetical protein